MNNAMRMMAVNRARGNGGESRMNAGYGYDGEMRYEGASRYDGGNMGYESRRRYARMDPEQEEREYRQNYNDGDQGDTSHRIRRANGEEWPRERRMDTYPQDRRMEARMNTIGFGGKVDMLSFPKQGRSRMNNQRFDRRAAEEWVEGMKNADGSKGEHWSMEKTEEVRLQKGLQCDPVEFWAAMNASYSDLGKMAKKHNLGIDFWVDYVKAFWFEDEDAGPDKLAMYHECFGKK